MGRPSILVFGLGFLQRSLIEQCWALGIRTVGIDISSDAECRDEVDVFEVVAGDDYETTLEVAKRHHVSGVVTAATDKPLVMMARVSEALGLPFYSAQTARWSTDKLQMKERFQEFGIPCARGIELESARDLDGIDWKYPVIVKPRDNSGSRGVVLCEDRTSAELRILEAFENTRMRSVLVEEYVDGQEYSIESMHYRGKTHVIQFTEKETTAFPYNVELGHIQPADLTDGQKHETRKIIERIADAMGFDNCASHTELKIGGEGIVVIETSPRLGGDFITSKLTPLSTGVNVERLLVRMSVGDSISEGEFQPTINMASGVVFFELPEGEIARIDGVDSVCDIPGYQFHEFNKKAGDAIGPIRSSLDRYGHAVFQAKNRIQLEQSMNMARDFINKKVVVINSRKEVPNE